MKTTTIHRHRRNTPHVVTHRPTSQTAPRAPLASRSLLATHHSQFAFFTLTLALAFALLAPATTRAQTASPSQLMVLVDKSPIVIEAPRPFIEASRLLPDAFAQRAQAIAPANRLLTWFIPALSLKEQLNDKPDRFRSLQVQAMREMEPVRYDAKAFATLRAQTLAATPMPQLHEEDTDTLFAMLDLHQLSQKASRKILGMADLGPDSFTLCVATSTEGSDQRGGREIETSVSCVTYILLNEKVLLLTVSGPEMTAKELRNSMRLTREWITLLRDYNNAK